MRMELYCPTWLELPPCNLSDVGAILCGAWSEGATAYAADWTAQRLTSARRGPVGVQRYLNSELDTRFQRAGWTAYSSTYTRGQIWLRVTFRHQMSIGSNFIDALKALGKHDYGVAIVSAPTTDFLKLVSPADEPALTSFEKLRAELEDLRGVLTAPVVIAALQPCSVLPPKTAEVILNPARRRK